MDIIFKRVRLGNVKFFLLILYKLSRVDSSKGI